MCCIAPGAGPPLYQALYHSLGDIKDGALFNSIVSPCDDAVPIDYEGANQ
jgi:hypothetical protein